MIANDETSIGEIIVLAAVGPLFGIAYVANKARLAIAVGIAKRRASKLAAQRKTKRKATRREAATPGRIRTARDHRRAYGNAPALRIINGGRA